MALRPPGPPAPPPRPRPPSTENDQPPSLGAPPDVDLIPSPYGYPYAVESMGGVAAPLLAGFSLTLAVLVLQLNPRMIRWPDLALLLLAAAAISFILSVQAAFWARAYFVTPEEARG